MNFSQYYDNNIKLSMDGWRLHTEYMEDGRIVTYATKNGARIELILPSNLEVQK